MGLFAGYFSRVILFAVGALLTGAAWTSDEGQPRVVGPLQPVVATLGDDVVIQCHLKPSLDVEAETVEWSRPDLEPDLSDRLSRIEYVHVHRDHGEFVDMKMAAYVGRTMMFVEEMKHGNISLKIVNVTMTDQGVYRCYVPKLMSSVKALIVRLVVEPNSVKTTQPPRTVQTPGPTMETNNNNVVQSHLGTLAAAVFIVLTLLVMLFALLTTSQSKDHPTLLDV